MSWEGGSGNGVDYMDSVGQQGLRWEERERERVQVSNPEAF